MRTIRKLSKGSRRKSRSVEGRLSGDVGEVLNRVRKAYGEVPMKGVSMSGEIREVEGRMEEVAKGVCCGGCEYGEWVEVLGEYERVWMEKLAELRGQVV